MMKKITSKERFCYIFCIASLAIFFAVFVVLTFTGFFYSTGIGQVSNIDLGENIVVAVKENQSSSVSFNFSGGILPNEKIPCVVDVFNNSDKPVFVRVKAVVFLRDQGIVNLDIKTLNNWVKNGEYYYFPTYVIPQETIGCLNAVEISQDGNFEGKYIYSLNILIETLVEQSDVQRLWGIDIEEG